MTVDIHAVSAEVAQEIADFAAAHPDDLVGMMRYLIGLAAVGKVSLSMNTKEPAPKGGQCSTYYDDGSRCTGTATHWSPGARAIHLLCDACAVVHRAEVYRLDEVEAPELHVDGGGGRYLRRSHLS